MSNLLASNIQNITLVTASITPSAVGANATVTQAGVKIPGVLPGDLVIVNPLVLTANLLVGDAIVTAADTVSLQLSNPTATPVGAGAAQNYSFLVVRPSAPSGNVIT